MKLILHFLLLSCLVLTLDSQAQNSVVTNVRFRVDTLRQQVVFQYDLPHVHPQDSLYLQLQTASGRVIRPSAEALTGEFGTNLTPGLNKTIFWAAKVDGQKFNENVLVIIYLVTNLKADSLLLVSRSGFNLSKKQIINLGRWTASAGLATYTIIRGAGLLSDIRAYTNKEAPINQNEKQTLDTERDELDQAKRRFYPWVAVSAAALLANAVITVVQKKRARWQKSAVSLTGSTNSLGLTYTF